MALVEKGERLDNKSDDSNRTEDLKRIFATLTYTDALLKEFLGGNR